MVSCMQNKSWDVHYMLEEEEELHLLDSFQKNKTSRVYQSFIDIELDSLDFLLPDGQHEEVDNFEFVLKDNSIHEGEVKEEDEVEEEKELDKESKGYQTSEEADE